MIFGELPVSGLFSWLYFQTLLELHFLYVILFWRKILCVIVLTIYNQNFVLFLVSGAWMVPRSKGLQHPGMELLLSLTKAVCTSTGYKICCAGRACSLWGRMVAAMLQSSTSVFVVPGSWNVALLLSCADNVLLSRPFC